LLRCVFKSGIIDTPAAPTPQPSTLHPPHTKLSTLNPEPSMRVVHADSNVQMFLLDPSLPFSLSLSRRFGRGQMTSRCETRWCSVATTPKKAALGCDPKLGRFVEFPKLSNLLTFRICQLLKVVRFVPQSKHVHLGIVGAARTGALPAIYIYVYIYIYIYMYIYKYAPSQSISPPAKICFPKPTPRGNCQLQDSSFAQGASIGLKWRVSVGD